MWRAAVLMLLVSATVACRSEPKPPWNLLLVTIDTLRADRVGAYGAKHGTPAIDAMADGATVFETAISTCPATAPAVASIMTGAHRATHRVFGNGWTMPPSVETLAERLRAQGYRTVARIANPAIDAGTGFEQGFDDFALPATVARTGPAMLEGEPLVAEAETLLDGFAGGPPFFLWLHFMDPHGPYFPPKEYRDAFPPDDYRWPADPPVLPIGGSNFGLGIIPAYQVVEGESSPAVYRARYDAEVRYVDAHVGAVLRALEQRGLSDRTVVVLTADHGESLGEHDYWFAHGWYVYDDALRVPLIFRGPGVPAGRRVKESVSLIDLMPTVLDLLGLTPVRAMEGTSLRPFFAGQASHREAFAQTYYGEGLAAYRSGTLKYVFKPPRQPGARPASDPPFPDEQQEWLFDLAADPGETKNVLSEGSAAALMMRARLQEWLRAQEERGRGHVAELPRKGGVPMRVQGDPQVERQLRALGYLD